MIESSLKATKASTNIAEYQSTDDATPEPYSPDPKVDSPSNLVNQVSSFVSSFVKKSLERIKSSINQFNDMTSSTFRRHLETEEDHEPAKKLNELDTYVTAVDKRSHQYLNNDEEIVDAGEKLSSVDNICFNFREQDVKSLLNSVTLRTTSVASSPRSPISPKAKKFCQQATPIMTEKITEFITNSFKKIKSSVSQIFDSSRSVGSDHPEIVEDHELMTSQSSLLGLNSSTHQRQIPRGGSAFGLSANKLNFTKENYTIGGNTRW